MWYVYKKKIAIFFYLILHNYRFPKKKKTFNQHSSSIISHCNRLYISRKKRTFITRPNNNISFAWSSIRSKWLFFVKKKIYIYISYFQIIGKKLLVISAAHVARVIYSEPIDGFGILVGGSYNKPKIVYRIFSYTINTLFILLF